MPNHRKRLSWSVDGNCSIEHNPRGSFWGLHNNRRYFWLLWKHHEEKPVCKDCNLTMSSHCDLISTLAELGRTMGQLNRGYRMCVVNVLFCSLFKAGISTFPGFLGVLSLCSDRKVSWLFLYEQHIIQMWWIKERSTSCFWTTCIWMPFCRSTSDQHAGHFLSTPSLFCAANLAWHKRVVLNYWVAGLFWSGS